MKSEPTESAAASHEARSSSAEAMPQPRNLFLCFDAFGTLFKPRQPVPQQYAEVARKWGLGGLSSADIASSFKEAYKHESTQNPNFGRANGLGPEKWWTNIITNTFQPLVGKDNQLPSGIVPELLQRFWCDKGYVLFDDVQPLIQAIRQAHHQKSTRVVVGVITNSDDRVPDILTSLGMRVSPVRFSSSAEEVKPSGADEEYDVDFTVMSYDVGHEKPDKRIFDAAEETLEKTSEGPHDPADWRKIYVGDEYSKDVIGAVEAGWNAVLIDRDTTRGRKDVDWLDPKPSGSLEDAFKSSKAVGFGSLAKLAGWLLPKT